jgi:16S rRNA processing protein RimM
MKARKPTSSAPLEPPAGYVAIARILGAWGIRGDVNIEPLASRKVLAPGRAVRVAGRDSRIERVRGAGRLFLKLTGIDDRETAAALRGEHVLVQERDLEPLPEGEYYRFQLIGLRVATIEGRDLGEVTDIISARENDVLVVTGPAGENLIPVIEDVVQEIDVEGGTVTIEAVPGLLKD